MAALFENPHAYAPFYDDTVAVEGKRGGRTLTTGALPACVLDQGLDDPISDGATSSTRRLYTVTVREADWPDTTPPRIGDVITLADGAKISVKAVVRSHGDFALEARSC